MVTGARTSETQHESLPERMRHLLALAGGAEPSEGGIMALARLLFNTLDALTHPLYIIDAKTYQVVLANGASRLGPLGRESTCHAVTHGLPYPCGEYGLDCPLQQVVRSRQPATAEHVHFDQAGGARTCEVHSYPIIGSKGTVTHVIEYNLDITDHRNSQEQLRLLGTAIESAANAIFVTDQNGRITWLNDAFCRVSGYARDEILGRRPDLWKSGLQNEDFYREMWTTILAGGIWRGRVVNRHKSGRLFIVEQTITPLADRQGEISNFVVVHEDMTAREEAEQEARRAARRDSLTGLANHQEFKEQIDREIRLVSVTGGEVAILLFDLDHFREINETFGRAEGDALLVAVSGRLRKNLRQTDVLARTGGDEFAVLEVVGREGEDLQQMAHRLLSVLSAPFEVAGRELRLSASIGISSGAACGADRLLEQAEIALYRAKVEGRSDFRFYAPNLDEGLRHQMELAFDLRGALARGELFLEFQPEVDITSQTIVGVEALLRWQHPDRGLIGPLEFIEVAERIGLSEPITEWVLRSACREAIRWFSELQRVIPLAVNVSANELHRSGFGDLVARVLAETGYPAGQLELEVTEWALMQGTPGVLANVRMLGDLGVTLAIDDFGAGFSSFESLRRCPIRTLKIPHRFVEMMCSDARDHAIVSTLVALARRLGLRHVVEGVETEGQFQLLRREACEVAQGFYLSRPVSAREIARLVREGSEILHAGSPGQQPGGVVSDS